MPTLTGEGIILAAALIAAFVGFCWLMWQLSKYKLPVNEEFNKTVDSMVRHEKVKAAIRKATRAAMGVKLPGEK